MHHASIRTADIHQAIAFYEQLGFKKVSEVYLEDDIPHIAMVKEYHAT